MNLLRRAGPSLALAGLAALTSAGCMLTSGQFVATYDLPDPITVSQNFAANFDVDLNTVSDYKDHKNDIKRVEDVSLVGEFTNNGTSTTQIEVWLVADTSLPVGPQPSGVPLWGPLTVAANTSEKVDWNTSSALFEGRQALIDEVKGDGHFRLYVAATGANCTVTKGALVVVVSAAI